MTIEQFFNYRIFRADSTARNYFETSPPDSWADINLSTPSIERIRENKFLFTAVCFWVVTRATSTQSLPQSNRDETSGSHSEGTTFEPVSRRWCPSYFSFRQTQTRIQIQFSQKPYSTSRQQLLQTAVDTASLRNSQADVFSTDTNVSNT